MQAVDMVARGGLEGRWSRRGLEPCSHYARRLRRTHRRRGGDGGVARRGCRGGGGQRRRQRARRLQVGPLADGDRLDPDVAAQRHGQGVPRHRPARVCRDHVVRSAKKVRSHPRPARAQSARRLRSRGLPGCCTGGWVRYVPIEGL
eukprot:317572-Prorocentrum_minimum.AAC.1